MLPCGQDDCDRVSRGHCSPLVDHTHDACPSEYVAGVVMANEFLEQAALETIDLGTGVAQAGHLHDGLRTKVEKGSSRQFQEVHPEGRHVLAQVPGCHGEPPGSKPLEQFLVHQVDLAQVGLGGICPDSRKVLNRGAKVGVPGHAKAFHQFNSACWLLAETVGGIEVECGNPRAVVHAISLSRDPPSGSDGWPIPDCAVL